MKTSLEKKFAIFVLILAFIIAPAKADEDYARFEQWLRGVYAAAPLYGLEVHPGAEDEEEFFYLYCWQSDDRTIGNALRMAKRIWDKNK